MFEATNGRWVLLTLLLPQSQPERLRHGVPLPKLFLRHRLIYESSENVLFNATQLLANIACWAYLTEYTALILKNVPYSSLHISSCLRSFSKHLSSINYFCARRWRTRLDSSRLTLFTFQFLSFIFLRVFPQIPDCQEFGSYLSCFAWFKPYLLFVRMHVNSDVCLCAIGALRQVSCLVDHFGSTADVTRFDGVLHFAFTNNIVLKGVN